MKTREHDDGDAGDGVEPPGERALLEDEELRQNIRVAFEAAKDAYPEVRRTLQRFGTEAVRENIGQDTWIRLMDDRIDDLTSDSLHVLVTDIRFPNEAELIKEWGGTLIRIERDTQQDGESAHVSEAGLDKIPYDYTIDNNGTLDDLRAAMAHLHFEVTRG